MTGNLGSGAHSLNGLFVKFCRCIQTLHNLHWIYYYLTKYCFQSVVSPVVIGGGGGCRSWIEGVALIEPRWHLHNPPVPSAEWHQLHYYNSTTSPPPECSWDWPGWQRVLTLKVHLWRGSWEDGRGEEEVRKRRKIEESRQRRLMPQLEKSSCDDF